MDSCRSTCTASGRFAENNDRGQAVPLYRRVSYSFRDTCRVTRRAEPSDSVVKTLFAHSGNACGFSDPERAEYCEQRLTNPEWKRVRARICHIRGLLASSERYDATMADSQRNAYENLLLLCPNHHSLIDDLEPDRYTVEELAAMKDRAERHAPSAQWADDRSFERMARSAITIMRQIWWGQRHLPIVRARQVQVGSLIEYEGEGVEIAETVRRRDGRSVHLTFAVPVETPAGTIVGWDLDDDDPLNIYVF